MKPRKVVVIIEMTTDQPIKDLKYDYLNSNANYPDEVIHQV
jgi:hypothetical protein